MGVPAADKLQVAPAKDMQPATLPIGQIANFKKIAKQSQSCKKCEERLTRKGDYSDHGKSQIPNLEKILRWTLSLNSETDEILRTRR